MAGALGDDSTKERKLYNLLDDFYSFFTSSNVNTIKLKIMVTVIFVEMGSRCL